MRSRLSIIDAAISLSVHAAALATLIALTGGRAGKTSDPPAHAPALETVIAARPHVLGCTPANHSMAQVFAEVTSTEARSNLASAIPQNAPDFLKTAPGAETERAVETCLTTQEDISRRPLEQAAVDLDITFDLSAGHELVLLPLMPDWHNATNTRVSGLKVVRIPDR